MANAVAFTASLTPTASALATVNATAGSVTPWLPSLGAKEFTIHLHVNTGTATVILEGVNYTQNGGAVAITPAVILTATGGATGDFYAVTTTAVPYQYLRLRCSAFSAGSSIATAVGVR